MHKVLALHALSWGSRRCLICRHYYRFNFGSQSLVLSPPCPGIWDLHGRVIGRWSDHSLLLRTLFQKYDWLWAMRIIAFMALGCYMLGVFLVRGRLPTGSKSRVTIDIRALASPRLCFLAAAVFSFEFIIFGCAALLPTYVRFAGFSEDLQFYSLTLLNGMSLFGRVLPGFAADQVGRFNTLLCMVCLTLIIMACLWLPYGAKGMP